MAKTVNRLIGIRHYRYANARVPQPTDDFAVEGIAVLSLVDDDFGETCRKGTAHRRSQIVTG